MPHDVLGQELKSGDRIAQFKQDGLGIVRDTGPDDCLCICDFGGKLTITSSSSVLKVA
mgnify:FL=1